ncbi:MAG: hypothetical protein ACK5PQ_04225 [Alphaproteobacteria bacterium]
MTIVLVLISDHSFILGSFTDHKLEKAQEFLSIDDFLSSSLWKESQSRPRLIYSEREKDRVFLNLEPLSPFEKFLLQIQKKIFPGFSYRLQNQLFLFNPEIPHPLLKDGQVIKVTCFLQELLTDRKFTSNQSGFFYYTCPFLGLWQIILTTHGVSFYHFSSLKTADQIQDAISLTLNHFKEENPDVEMPIDLYPTKETPPLVPIKSTGLYYQKINFPSDIYKAIAAGLLLVACLIYNTISFQKWDEQLHHSRQTLAELKTSLNTVSLKNSNPISLRVHHD